jgi:hypothetical protein
LGIGVAQNATVFLGLVLFGAVGSFAATDFLLAAMFAPLFLAFSMFALMYNDLIFLQNRVKRAWANIEVSLKKRCDLIPNLEQVVKSYLSHEEGIMEKVAQIRSSVTGKNKFSPSEVDVLMGQEVVLSNKIFALREAYPDLKSNEMMEDFMNRLARMENEVSMMRAGYNDGVERYRTVMQRFPELILAKVFGFKDQKSLTFNSDIRQVPKIELTINESEATDSGEELPHQSVEDNVGKNRVEEIEKEVTQIPSDSKQFSEIYLHKQGEQYGPYNMSQIEGFLISKDFTLEDLACWDGGNWEKIDKIPGLNYPPK